MFESLVDVLAQATTTTPQTPPPGGTAPPGAPGQMGTLLWGLAAATIVFYIFLFRGQDRRKQQNVDKMIKALKKNDRVVTIGGIVGTVINTRDDEVVLRVDESSNTKMTFVRRTIQRVLADDEKPAEEK